MPVKKYRTRSIQEAVSKIKRDLGPNAIILSTRQIGDPSLPSGGREKVEVAALLPEDLTGNPRIASEWKKKEGVARREGPQFNYRQGDAIFTERQGTLQEELSGIKDMLYSMTRRCGLPDFLQAYPEALHLYAKLVRAGISEGRANGFVERACRQAEGGPLSRKEMGRRVFAEIFQSIAVADPFRENEQHSGGSGRKLMAFVGPTGVGKTTTIAKLAADLHLKHRRKVGLLSIDNYRIGAVEQLKTYAAIIGLPCLSAFTREDVQNAARRMENREIVLIDTAGQGYQDRKRLAELAHMMGGEPRISSHLVLSLVSRELDMQKAASQFSRLNPSTYIFTKADETVQCGCMIDQVHEYNLPISFITHGQNVPEDIMAATRRNISRLVFGRL